MLVKSTADTHACLRQCKPADKTKFNLKIARYPRRKYNLVPYQLQSHAAHVSNNRKTAITLQYIHQASRSASSVDAPACIASRCKPHLGVAGLELTRDAAVRTLYVAYNGYKYPTALVAATNNNLVLMIVEALLHTHSEISIKQLLKKHQKIKNASIKLV